MELALDVVETRILGCLMEKERTTPEYYPLTLNSLIAACNQKSNRDPVLELDEEAVLEGVDSLREKRLVFRVDVAGSRVAKYRHSIDNHFDLNKGEFAVLCTLLLRGPQTLGELRTRSERMVPFASLAEVGVVLDTLQTDRETPLVVELPRRPGRKEARYLHTLAPLPDPGIEAESAVLKVEPSNRYTREEGEALAAEVATLKERVALLEQRLAEQIAAFERLRAELEG